MSELAKVGKHLDVLSRVYDYLVGLKNPQCTSFIVNETTRCTLYTLGNNFYSSDLELVIEHHRMALESQ